MEQQIFPLLATDKSGGGTVLLQNHLGDFGLEKLLAPPSIDSVLSPSEATTAVPPAATSPIPAPVIPAPIVIPGEGVIVSARQLTQAFSGWLLTS